MMKKTVFGIIACLLLSTSCTSFPEAELDLPVHDDPVHSVNLAEVETFVSEAEALAVAHKFSGKPLTRSMESGIQAESGMDVKYVVDENGEPLMYIINYPDKRFVIVGANRNYYPILAYSNENNFSLSEESGVSVWLKETEQIIGVSDEFDEDVLSRMRFLWNMYEEPEPEEAVRMETRTTPEESFAMHKRISDLRSMYPQYNFKPLIQCSPSEFAWNGPAIYNQLCNLATQFRSPIEYTIIGIRQDRRGEMIGPLLTTSWHQWFPYNQLSDPDSPAGCVAIAMGQIMAFHQFPNNYNWNNIVNNDGTVETQLLIRDIGIAVDMDYDPNGSGSNIDEAKNAFEDIFNYSARKADYNYQETANELLLNKRPVYMRGVDKSGAVGHAWVCDGIDDYCYETTYFIQCREGSSGNYTYRSIDGPSLEYPGTVSFYGTKLHMNWGWDENNGWFYDVSVDGDNFSDDRKNLYVNPNR